MTLTLEQIEAIEAGCEGGTPGPYFVPPNNPAAVCREGQFGAVAKCSERLGEFNERDALHFANCDPATILALCAGYRKGLEVEGLVALLHQVHHLIDQYRAFDGQQTQETANAWVDTRVKGDALAKSIEAAIRTRKETT
jgi:hypothetical protein